MIKVALVLFVTSISNKNELPEVSITGFYNDLKSCHKVLDKIKVNLNTKDYTNNKKIRFLSMEIREAHQEGMIYWSCIEKK